MCSDPILCLAGIATIAFTFFYVGLLTGMDIGRVRAIRKEREGR